jgi:hypothetical protein
LPARFARLSAGGRWIRTSGTARLNRLKGITISIASKKPEQSRSPAPQSEKNFLLSVNYLTLLDRFLNDAA